MARPDPPRFFDEHDIPDDVMLVLRAASLLETGEFTVFEIAYRQWFGETGDEKTIERHFVRYMFNDIVPAWVCHFARRVLDLDHRDALDPGVFGLAPRQPDRGAQQRGAAHFLWIAIVMIVLIVAARVAADSFPGTRACMLPPCYGESR